MVATMQAMNIVPVAGVANNAIIKVVRYIPNKTMIPTHAIMRLTFFTIFPLSYDSL